MRDLSSEPQANQVITDDFNEGSLDWLLACGSMSHQMIVMRLLRM
jgi:hypothetical protein